MADEPVTKKEMQALEKRLTVKNTELEKTVSKNRQDAAHDDEETQKTLINVNKAIKERLDGIAKVIESTTKDFTKRIAYLEQQSRMIK